MTEHHGEWTINSSHAGPAYAARGIWGAGRELIRDAARRKEMKKEKTPVLSLCDICLCITSAESFNEVMQKIVKKATELFNLKGALIRLLEKQGHKLEVASYYGLSEEYVRKGPIILDNSLIDQEAIKGETVIIKNALKDKRIQYPDKVKKEGIQSIIVIPLKTQSHVHGVLRCYFATPHNFSDTEVENFEQLAGQAAVAIENLKALERNRSLLEMSKIVNSSLDLTTVLKATVKFVVEAMKVKAATIRILDERQHKMVLKASFGLSDEFLKKGPYDIEDLPIDQEVLRGTTVYIPQVTRDTRFKYADVADKEGIVSALAVPLNAMDRSLGTMRVYTATEYEFSDDEKNFLLTLANQAAIAINNALLYDRLHTLFLVSSSLSKSLDMREVFKTIVEGATKAMNAQGSALLLLDVESNKFQLVHSIGVSEHFLSAMADKYINCSREILCGETVIKCQLDADVLHVSHKVAMKEGILAFMNIPMKAKEHLIGILQIYFTSSRAFTADEVEFFTALANEAAVAIENAKLYEHINLKYNNLVEDIFLWYDGTSRGMEH
jgi:GAF domain-containing protein